MANFMVRNLFRCCQRSVLTVILCGLSGFVLAADVMVVGIFPGKAVLVINGGNPKTLSIGQTVGGVKLLEVERDAVVLEIDGKKDRISMGTQPVTMFESRDESPNGQTINLTADSRGHFSTVGSINGATVRFFVDTGASSVAMGPDVARQAGIDYLKGESGYASTANGVVQTWRVKLNKVTVGDVTLRDVEGTVLQLDMPQVLLGTSFLNRMEMRRDGSTMSLKRRY